MARRKVDAERVDAARAALLADLRPGDTVYTVLQHLSRSGMGRSISPIVVRGRSDAWDASWAVGALLGYSFDQRNGGLKVSGAGMDMGFHLVYSLSRVLFRDVKPRKLPERLQHHADDPGYWLQHRWL